MRVFSKKAFQFDHPADPNEASVTVQALSFADVPEWVTESSMFKLASAEGSVEVIENKVQEAAAEKKQHPVSNHGFNRCKRTL
jgi:hypothetical protein